VCALGQVLRLSIACLYGVVGGGWALSAPLAQKGNSLHDYHYQQEFLAAMEKIQKLRFPTLFVFANEMSFSS